MSVAVKPIDVATDDRIACYSRENYDFRSLKARSMAWFIQVAIRRDMNMSVNGGLDYDNPLVQPERHREILNKIDDLEQIIRQHHIIDEAALESIGLTLYNFPTLAYFFVAPEKQAFVREVTVRELLDKADYLKNIVLDSALADYLAEHDGDEDSESEAIALLHHMTLSTLEKEAGLDQEEIQKEKFLLVDMAAPVTILKQQFLKLQDRESRLKQGAYDDWEEYGVLPYLDIQRWVARNHQKLKANTRVALIYANRLHGYGPKKIQETTIPHIEKLMDVKGPVFRGLLADASKEFRGTISWTRQEDPEANAIVAGEVLQRWLPRSYPDNFPDLERTARSFPSPVGDQLQMVIEITKIDAQKRSLVDRIRNMSQDVEGTGLLRAMENLRDNDGDPVIDSAEAEIDTADYAAAV